MEVFSLFNFNTLIENGKLDVPSHIVIPETTILLIYVLIPDNAYLAKRNIMRPFLGLKLELKT